MYASSEMTAPIMLAATAGGPWEPPPPSKLTKIATILGTIGTAVSLYGVLTSNDKAFYGGLCLCVAAVFALAIEVFIESGRS